MKNKVLPNPPRRDCKSAEAWSWYYANLASWYQEIAANITELYPESAEHAKVVATRFLLVVKEIKNKTHVNIVNGNWK